MGAWNTRATNRVWALGEVMWTYTRGANKTIGSSKFGDGCLHGGGHLLGTMYVYMYVCWRHGVSTGAYLRWGNAYMYMYIVIYCVLAYHFTKGCISSLQTPSGTCLSTTTSSSDTFLVTRKGKVYHSYYVGVLCADTTCTLGDVCVPYSVLRRQSRVVCEYNPH